MWGARLHWQPVLVMCIRTDAVVSGCADTEATGRLANACLPPSHNPRGARKANKEELSPGRPSLGCSGPAQDSAGTMRHSFFGGAPPLFFLVVL